MTKDLNRASREDFPHTDPVRPFDVALLTGGGDKPYAMGLAAALSAIGRSFELIGSDDLDLPVLSDNPQVRFLNLRGDQDPTVGFARKTARILLYYVRLITYAARTRATIFHLLWNNKFEMFDQTVLLLYYRILGKRLVKTVHNVNKAERDGRDSRLNRWTLRCEYRLHDHLFVHTARMKRELELGYGVPSEKISIIPFGVNQTVPDTDLSAAQARNKLGLSSNDRVVLFFGNIAPYKGVEHLVEAMILLARKRSDYKLIIAGRPKGSEAYWDRVQGRIRDAGLDKTIVERIEYVPDEDTEIYFKAADVLVLPYTHIFQSGVLFLGYGFGLPAIASDVGSLSDDIVTGKTGYVVRPEDPGDLAKNLEHYFENELYQNLPKTRSWIREHARLHHSWDTVGEITVKVYKELSKTKSNRNA